MAIMITPLGRDARVAHRQVSCQKIFASGMGATSITPKDVNTVGIVT